MTTATGHPPQAVNVHTGTTEPICCGFGQRVIRWFWTALGAAALCTGLDIAHILLYAPAARSDAPGLLICAMQCMALFWFCAVPIALVGAWIDAPFRKMVGRISAAGVLSVAFGIMLGALGLTRLRDLLGQGQIRSFPDRIDALLLLSTVALLLLAVFASFAIHPLLRRLFERFSVLHRPRFIAAGGGVVFVAAMTGATACQLYAVHLDAALPFLAVIGGSLFTCAIAAFDSGARRRLRWRPLLLLLCALAVLPPIGLVFNIHARYVLFQNAPMAGALTTRLWILSDLNGDRTALREVSPAKSVASPVGGPSVPLHAGCAAVRQNPSVILITIDALRADALRPAAMPNLSKFARSATVFDRAFVTSGYTEYAFLSFFSGAPLSDLLVDNPMVNKTYCAPTTFPERFQRAGYHTAAFSHVIVPAAVFRGFQSVNHYEYPLDANVVGEFDEHGPLRSALSVQQMMAFVSENPDKPYMLWSHFTDLHAPYNPPETLYGKQLQLSPYEQEAAYVDHHIGRFLEWLSQRNGAADTIIVITADHGEELMENGREGHGVSTGLHTIHVPLLLWIPGCPPRRVAHPVSLADLGNTLLSLSGVETDGPQLSLRPDPPGPVVSEIFHRRDRGNRWLRSFVYGDFQLSVDVLHGGAMLFNLTEDPGQRQNLYYRLPDVARTMESLYNDWVAQRAVRKKSCIPGVDRDGPGGITFGRKVNHP